MSPGPHVVTSTSKFGGYVYGFGSFNGYSWPAGSATRTLDAIDTLPPVLSFDTECGEYHYKATELRSFSSIPDTVQFDQGIYDIQIIDSLSSNFRLSLLTTPVITPLPRITEFKFDVTVIDKTKDAFAVFAVIDRAVVGLGNAFRDLAPMDESAPVHVLEMASPASRDEPDGHELALVLLGAACPLVADVAL